MNDSCTLTDSMINFAILYYLLDKSSFYLTNYTKFITKT